MANEVLEPMKLIEKKVVKYNLVFYKSNSCEPHSYANILGSVTGEWFSASTLSARFILFESGVDHSVSVNENRFCMNWKS